MSSKKIWGLGLVILFLVLNSSCLFTRIDEIAMKARHYKTYTPREYFAPTQYIKAGDVDYAYVEKGKGPTVVLLHGGIVTFDLDKSLLINPYWDLVSDVVPPAALYTLVVALTANTTYGLAGVVAINEVIPARAQSLIHFGAISTINTWEYNFNQLAENLHVIALDLPGFGNSSKPDSRYTVPDMTKYLDSFLEAKGLDKVYLVGQDYSGLLAIDYSLTYPDKVAGLVLIAPYGTQSHPWYYPVHLIWHYPRWIARNMYRDKAARVDVWRNVLKRAGKRTYTRIFYKPESKLIEDTSSQYGRLIYNDNEQSRKFVNDIIKYKFDTNWINTKEFADELYATHLSLQDVGRKDYWGIWSLKDEERNDWITRVKLIQAPTLIMWGKFDPLIPPEEASYLDRAIPNSVATIYEKSSHYPMVEESEAFNADVTRFICGAAGTCAK